MAECRPIKTQSLALLLSCVGWAATPVAGATQEFHVDLARENSVRFTSDAPLDDFQGITDRIDGFLFLQGDGLDGESDLAASQFYFEVDLASLDTGIGLRNRHMRDNYLETDLHPFASMDGRVVRLDQAGPGRYTATVRGVFTVHGVERQREMECTGIRTGEGREGLHVTCGFDVVLSDHQIPIPKLMFMKIDEIMEVDLDFYLSPVQGGKRS